MSADILASSFTLILAALDKHVSPSTKLILSMGVVTPDKHALPSFKLSTKNKS